MRRNKYDEQDRLRRYGTVAYSYTADGSLLQKLDEATNAITTYAYDAFGSPASVELPDGRFIEYINDAREAGFVAGFGADVSAFSNIESFAGTAFEAKVDFGLLTEGGIDNR